MLQVKAAVFCLSALLLPVFASAGQALAQTAAATVNKARALYYTPVDAGLQGFHCEVNFNWRDFMEKAAKEPVQEGDARLAYLQSIKLSVDDDLRGQGRMNWEGSTPEPEGSADSVAKVRGGLQQLWSGFFQSWNGFVTGDIVTLDAKATVETTASGFHVAVRDGANLAEEQYDPKLVLQTVHVSTPSLESTISPAFSSGPHGLLVNSIRSTYRQPPSSDPTEVLMQVNYAPVGTFQLPSEVAISVGPASFNFRLVNCTVRTQLTTK